MLSTCSLLTFPCWIAATKTLDLCSPAMTPLATFFLLNENSDTIHQWVSPRLLCSPVVSLNFPSSMPAFPFLTTRRIKGNHFLAVRSSQAVGFCRFVNQLRYAHSVSHCQFESQVKSVCSHGGVFPCPFWIYTSTFFVIELS